MHLDTLELLVHNVFGFLNDVVHTCVNGTKADEPRLCGCLFQNKIIDVPCPVSAHSHRQDHETVYACCISSFQQSISSAVHFIDAFELIKLPDAVGSLAGNGRWVNVGVNVNQLHSFASKC